MDELEDKKLEAFIDKLMEEAPLESPSVDFTQHVLHKLEADTPNEVFQYKPIVSGKVLSVAFIIFVALLILIGSQVGLDSGQGWFKNLNIEALFHTDWSWMEGYTSSKVTVYAFLSFGLLFFAQVPWLKKQMDKTAF
ncbi:hypothetical protein PY092_04805 [Muricauda sp. 334s03]|uniref:Uncharacterized protein n=1 Tax=Flagellimonas yonaguniensis TaxID=3031325 RepID=A0ABT5XW92_9FLAO|nr:hypothetical protein [[Muricauda] yonaguniensis]MDF0715460.1 hypothetical protein [[Muricauda] yonaguniensis]